MTHTRPRTLSALLPALLLTACFQATPPEQPAPVTLPTVPVPAGPAAPGPSELTPLGNVTLNFSGLGDVGALKVGVGEGLGEAGLSDRGSIQLKVLSNGTFTTGKRGAGGVRYLYATLQIRNADVAGTPYPTARQNLTLVAVSTPGTVANTPYSALLKYDGSTAPAAIAPAILPTAGLTFDRQTERPALLPGGEDFQAFTESEVQPLQTGNVLRAYPFGYVVRHRQNAAARTLPASPAAGDYAGVVTIGLKLPLQADPADDPYSFNMTFAVADDNVTRVTESPEEQTLGGVQGRASALGAGTQVAVLCGSSYAGPNALFLGSVTTAGPAGSGRLAHLGGDVALTTPPTTYTTPGNVNFTAPAASGLGQFYAAYPTAPGGALASLNFAGDATARGGLLNVAPDGAFTFTSRVGDGAPAVTDALRYTVSDGHGCTSPVQTAPVNVSGRVWFARDTAAPGGDGRQSTPLATATALQAASADGDTLYVYRGSGTLTGSLSLKSNQTLLGEGAALTAGATTLLPVALPSTLNNPSGAGLTLASGNTVRGLNVSGTSAGVTGTGFGTLTAAFGNVSASAGPALNLTGGTLNATAARLDATHALSNSAGVLLSGVGGTLRVLGGAAPGSGGVIQASGSGSSGYAVRPGAASLTLSLNRVQLQNSGQAGIFVSTQAADPGRVDLTVQNSTLLDNRQASVLLLPAGTGSNRFNVTNNVMTHSDLGAGVLYQSSPRNAGVTDQGFITNNTVSVSAASTSNGVTVDSYGAGNARFDISNNTVTSFGTYGISVTAQAAGAGRVDALVRNNTVSSPGGNGLDGISLTSGTVTTGDNNTLCALVTGNRSAAAGDAALNGTAGITVRQRAGTTLILPGITDTSNAGVTTYFQANNVPSTARVRSGATLTPVTGTCQAPT